MFQKLSKRVNFVKKSQLKKFIKKKKKSNFCAKKKLFRNILFKQIKLKYFLTAKTFYMSCRTVILSKVCKILKDGNVLFKVRETAACGILELLSKALNSKDWISISFVLQEQQIIGVVLPLWVETRPKFKELIFEDLLAFLLKLLSITNKYNTFIKTNHLSAIKEYNNVKECSLKSKLIIDAIIKLLQG